MRSCCLALAVLALAAAVCCAQEAPAGKMPTFKKVQLSDKFYAEGACFGDFNRDGKMDVIAGPWWFEGPDFTTKHVIHEPKEFDPHDYSDNFLTYVGDFNGDGYPDVVYVPYPGKECYWYENPQGKDVPWTKHLAAKVVDNESPQLVDLDGKGHMGLLCCAEGKCGYYAPDPAKPTEPWPFVALTPKGNYQKFTHGLGWGDLKGDGKMCLLESEAWWEPPANWKPGDVFVKHPFHFADAAAQMLVTDVDGDGLADVITSWHCHQYGLLWWKQVRSADGQITWERHDVLPAKPDLKSSDLRISELHAQKLVDLNKSGRPGVLTGKRWWAHGPSGDPEAMAPAVLYWFEIRRDAQKGATLVPHLLDDNSGVGTQVEAVDLNGDGYPDPIVGNKKGIFLFLSQPPAK